MKKIIAANFILALFLVCFMGGGVYAQVSETTAPAVAVPEPSSLLMLGSGLIGIAALVRKIKKN